MSYRKETEVSPAGTVADDVGHVIAVLVKSDGTVDKREIVNTGGS